MDSVHGDTVQVKVDVNSSWREEIRVQFGKIFNGTVFTIVQSLTDACVEGHMYCSTKKQVTAVCRAGHLMSRGDYSISICFVFSSMRLYLRVSFSPNTVYTIVLIHY